PVGNEKAVLTEIVDDTAIAAVIVKHVDGRDPQPLTRELPLLHRTPAPQIGDQPYSIISLVKFRRMRGRLGQFIPSAGWCDPEPIQPLEPTCPGLADPALPAPGRPGPPVATPDSAIP